MKSIHGFIYFLIVLLVSAGVFAAYLSINNIGAGPGNLPQLLQGTANRPAVYRVLIPTLAKSGSRLIPPETTAVLQNIPENNMLTRAFHRISGNQYPEEAFCVLILLYLSLTGFAYLEKSLLRDLGYSQQEQLVLPLTLLIMILPFSVHFAYIYDIPQFFLSAACLLLMYRKKWIVYLAVFAIAVLNKETSLFITFVFATYHFGRLPGKRYLLLLVSQLEKEARLFAACIQSVWHHAHFVLSGGHANGIPGFSGCPAGFWDYDFSSPGSVSIMEGPNREVHFCSA